MVESKVLRHILPVRYGLVKLKKLNPPHAFRTDLFLKKCHAHTRNMAQTRTRTRPTTRASRGQRWRPWDQNYPERLGDAGLQDFGHDILYRRTGVIFEPRYITSCQYRDSHGHTSSKTSYSFKVFECHSASYIFFLVT